MFKQLPKWRELKTISKRFLLKNPDVWDIAIYGSLVRGKEDLRDIDIGIIFLKEANAGKKLSLAQDFKEDISGLLPDFEFDVQAIDGKDFLDNGFLARQGIIAEGFLILRGKYLAEMLGFKTFVLVEYALQGLSY